MKEFLIIGWIGFCIWSMYEAKEIFHDRFFINWWWVGFIIMFLPTIFLVFFSYFEIMINGPYTSLNDPDE